MIGIQSAACVSAPAWETGGARPSATPQHHGQWMPQKRMPPRPEEERDARKGPAGRVTPDTGRSERMLKMFDEKCSLSPVSPATEGHHVGRSRPRGSSAKRGRTSEHLESPPEERPKRRKCSRKSPASRVQLFKSGKSLQLSAGPVVEPPDRTASSYDDYFSPENLRERNSETLLPGWQSPSSPARSKCTVGLSKRERTSVLEMSDFSCIGKSLTSTDIASSTVETSSSPPKPLSVEPNAPLGGMTPKTPPAAEEAPGYHRQGEAQTREGVGPNGSPHPRTGPELAHPPAHHSYTTPTKGSDREVKELVGVLTGVQKEGTTSSASSSSKGESNLRVVTSSVL